MGDRSGRSGCRWGPAADGGSTGLGLAVHIAVRAAAGSGARSGTALDA
ncbi:hypothetical protein AB0C84_40375 [Actinomadura sp. NPDC048955]